MSRERADRMLADIMSHPASRRRFIAGAAAMGLSAQAISALTAGAQTPSASPAAGDLDPLDPLVLAGDTVNGTFPVTEEPVTFTVLVPSNVSVGSFEDNDFTRWYEEKTNVHLEWQVVPAEEATTALNVRLASGDYPDILMSMNPEPAVQQLYGTQGIFVALNQYLDEHAVEYRRMVEQYPLTPTTITATDGNIYSLPYVNDCYHCAQDRKFWIYRPWLDALGLSMPQTTEEFYTALKAFKEQDPNGNGEADEVPISSCATGGWNSELDLCLMNSFVFNPGEPWLSVRDGAVTAVYTTDGWREGTRYLARLYAEGLIDPQSFTQDNAQLLALGNSEPPVLGAAPGGSWGVFVQWTPTDPSGRWAEYELMPPLEGPQGVRIAPFNPYLPYATGNFIVTDRCQHPEIAVRWADGLYDLETTLRSVQGVLGEQWRWAEPGELGRDGQQAIWAAIPQPEAAAQTGPGSSAWVQTGPSYRSGRVRFGEVFEQELRPYDLDVITEEILRPHRQPAEWWLPPLFFETEQAQLVAQTETTIVPYVRESFARFITGQGNVDEEWESYLEQLEAMGLQPYLDVNQQAYDAQQSAL